TFTSPLGVLLPAGLSWLTGNTSDELVLWLFRFTSIAALGAAVVCLLRMLLVLQRHRISTLLTVALIALDAKTVDFSINGMETGFVLLFLALALHGLLVPGPRQMLRIGVAWAGMMWTRPDGFVYIAALGLGALLFLPTSSGARTRREWWRTLFGAALVCAALYLPWLLWAWWYYGSPVPHTVVAKATNRASLSAVELVENVLLFPVQVLVGDSSLPWTFLPHYAWFGGWYDTVHAAARIFGLVAAFAWLVPLLRPTTRMFSLAFYVVQLYLSVVVKAYFPWYLPAGALLGYLTVGLLFDQVLGFASRLPELGWNRGWFRYLPLALRAGAFTLVAGQLALTVCVARQMRVQQAPIEDGLRRQIGLWLHDHARSPHDTVLLEPLGYIGYFSGLKMLDVPGLSSREMVETRRRLGPDKEAEAYLELLPDWMVLRPSETQYRGVVDPTRLGEFYEVAQIFDAG